MNEHNRIKNRNLRKRGERKACDVTVGDVILYYHKVYEVTKIESRGDHFGGIAYFKITMKEEDGSEIRELIKVSNDTLRCCSRKED